MMAMVPALGPCSSWDNYTKKITSMSGKITHLTRYLCDVRSILVACGDDSSTLLNSPQIVNNARGGYVCSFFRLLGELS